MKIQTRSITLAATMSALSCATYMIPFVFFIPVTVAATTLSFGLTAFVGLAFGAISVAYSFLFPTGLVAMAFVQAPYIAILPRVLAAVGAFGVYKLITRFLKPTKKPARFAAVSASAAVCSLLNTALVVGMMVLILPNLSDGSQTMLAYSVELVIRGAIEVVCMAALTPPITLTLEKVVLRRGAKKPTAIAATAQNGNASECADDACVTETADGKAAFDTFKSAEATEAEITECEKTSGGENSVSEDT